MIPDLDRDRAAQVAQSAIARINALGHALTPPNFEFWFTYYTGHKKPLNEAVDALTASDKLPSLADVERLYHRFVSPQRFAQEVYLIGGLVREQSTTVASTIDEVAGATETYGDHLAGVVREMVKIDLEASLQRTMTGLLQSTEDIQALNTMLKGRLIGAAEQISQLQERLDRVQIENMIDPVTNVGNRRLLDMCLPRMVAKAEHGNEPISLLLIDIDNFKYFNDRYGHVLGDDVLRLVANAIKQNSRRDDLVCRYGGDEFAVVLPNTPIEGALLAGEKARAAIAVRELRKRSTNESLGRLFVSVGAAQHRANDPPEGLVERADQWMYLSKRAARDVDHGSTDVPDETKRRTRSKVPSGLIWQSAYECGEAEIDGQHRKLFDLANALFASPHDGDQSTQFVSSVDDLLNHIAEHFAYEESVLRAHGYGGFVQHRMIHSHLLEEGKRLRHALVAGDDVLGELRRFLFRKVVAEHMLATDRQFFSLFAH